MHKNYKYYLSLIVYIKYGQKSIERFINILKI
nr:MAG TPA: hypothetical protein [Caudoviricetes sp.]